MIKQLVLITTLAATALTASTPIFADIFGNIDYNYYDGVGKTSDYDANGYSVNFGGKVYKSKLDSVTLDVKSEFIDINDTDNSVTQLEGGANYQYNLNNDFGLYGRVGLGNNWVSEDTKTDFVYYSLEPGVKWYPNDNSAVGLAYRFRDSFDTADEYQTSTFRLNGEYSFDNVNSVVAGYDYTLGDQEYNTYKIGYLARF